MSDGVLNIDGFKWSIVKLSIDELSKLDEEARNVRKQAEKVTFNLYHERLRGWIEAHGGHVWVTSGDCTIAHGFPTIDNAIAAAKSVQCGLSDFNIFENKIGTSLMVRIGIARGTLPNIPVDQRGECPSPELDEAGHLQKDCPPGRIRISRSVYDELRWGKHDFRPGLSFGLKSKSGGSYVWIERMLSAQERDVIAPLTSKQKRSCPPIIFSKEDFIRIPVQANFTSIRDIIKNAFVIIGETRLIKEPGDPVYHAAATSDAVGILEVFAALQSAPSVSAGIDEWVDSGDLAAQTNIVVVGSPAVNLFAYAINQVTPVGFVQNDYGPLRIRVENLGKCYFYPGDFSHSDFDKHYGFVYLTRNPINPDFHLLWIAGISGMATQASARFVCDLVTNPNAALDKIRCSNKESNIGIIVPKWLEGYKPEEYQGMWRVNDYTAVWTGCQ